MFYSRTRGVGSESCAESALKLLKGDHNRHCAIAIQAEGTVSNRNASKRFPSTGAVSRPGTPAPDGTEVRLRQTTFTKPAQYRHATPAHNNAQNDELIQGAGRAIATVPRLNSTLTLGE